MEEVAFEELHAYVGVSERFQRFREVSGVPAIEAALAELNERLSARGAVRTPLFRLAARTLTLRLQRSGQCTGIRSQMQVSNAAGSAGWPEVP